MDKIAPSSYNALRDSLLVALGYPEQRRPLLIAVDGRDGAGKSSLASWLAWQLGTPAIHLDLLLRGGGISWRIHDLKRLLDTRLGRCGPVIVEGVLVLDALALVGRAADYTIFVKNEGEPCSNSLMRQIESYWDRHQLPNRADHLLVWREPEPQTIEAASAEFQSRLNGALERD